MPACSYPCQGSGDLYSYAIVTDNLGVSLFVLARDPDMFTAQYDAKVKAQLAAWNFNGFLNTPTATTQKGCKYA